MLGLPTGDDNGWFGQLFLMFCYGFILFQSAVLIGDGSEKLLLIYGAGFVGGLVIPVLGAIPDAAIILVSGLGSDAQCEISIGVGTLAGSTIMLLTIPWAISIILGLRDRDPVTGKAASYPGSKKGKYENGFTLFQSCITVYENVPFSVKIMMVTSLSYLIIAIPDTVYKTSSAQKRQEVEHIPALVGLIVCSVAFILYSISQIRSSQAIVSQEMRVEQAQFVTWRRRLARNLGTDAALRQVFDNFDKDRNGTIDRNELDAGFKALGLQCSRQQIFEIMKSMTRNKENTDAITYDDFAYAVKHWARPIMTKTIIPLSDDNKTNVDIDNIESDVEFAEQENREHGTSELTPLKSNINTDTENENKEKSMEKTDIDANRAKLLQDIWTEMETEAEEEEEEKMLDLSNKQVLSYALFQLFIGTVLVAIFSDSMVDTISNFSTTINVNAFYVSFIVTPICSNASEIYSAFLFASKKSTQGITLALSTLYGAACMNNTFVLCVFCALIFVQRLQWTFLVETLAILITVIIIGLNGLSDTIYAWQAILGASLFPLALVFIAATQSILDDSNSC